MSENSLARKYWASNLTLVCHLCAVIKMRSGSQFTQDSYRSEDASVVVSDPETFHVNVCLDLLIDESPR